MTVGRTVAVGRRLGCPERSEPTPERARADSQAVSAFCGSGSLAPVPSSRGRGALKSHARHDSNRPGQVRSLLNQSRSLTPPFRRCAVLVAGRTSRQSVVSSVCRQGRCQSSGVGGVLRRRRPASDGEKFHRGWSAAGWCPLVRRGAGQVWWWFAITGGAGLGVSDSVGDEDCVERERTDEVECLSSRW